MISVELKFTVTRTGNITAEDKARSIWALLGSEGEVYGNTVKAGRITVQVDEDVNNRDRFIITVKAGDHTVSDVMNMLNIAKSLYVREGVMTVRYDDGIGKVNGLGFIAGLIKMSVFDFLDSYKIEGTFKDWKLVYDSVTKTATITGKIDGMIYMYGVALMFA